MRTLRADAFEEDPEPPGARRALRGPPRVPAGRRHRRCRAPGRAGPRPRIGARGRRAARLPRSPRRRAPWPCSEPRRPLAVPPPRRGPARALHGRSTRRWPAPARRRSRSGRCGWARRSTPDTLAGTAVPGWARALGAEARAGRRAGRGGSTRAPRRRRSTGSCGRRRRRRRSGRPRAAPRRWPAGGRDGRDRRARRATGPTWWRAGIPRGRRSGARSRRCARRSSTARGRAGMSNSPWRCASPGRSA